MAETRKRRIVKRVALYSAALVLLFAAYISSYVGLFWLRGHGSIDSPIYLRLGRTVYAPIGVYTRYHLPGWTYLERANICAYWNGRGEPMPPGYWEQLEEGWRNAK